MAAGAKAHLYFQAFAARLKSCPVTKRRLSEIPKPTAGRLLWFSTAVSRKIRVRNLGIFFYALVSLLLDIDLRKLPFDGCCDGGVFRLSAGAGQGITSVRGVFNRVAPGLRKYKIGFRQVFPFCVRQFRHSVHPWPFQSLNMHFLSGRRVRVCSKLHSWGKTSHVLGIDPAVFCSLFASTGPLQ